MRKKAVRYIILFIFTASLLLSANINRIASYTNIQALKYSSSKNNNTAPFTSIYSLPQSAAVVKSAVHAKPSIAVQPSTPTPSTAAKPNNGLTVLRKDQKNIDIYFSMSNGKKSFIRIENKSNGTWNLRSWYLSKDNQIPSKDAILLAGSSSDWEYVLRVTDNVNTPYQFSGGSHYNEILQSFKLYDNIKNKEFSLSTGQKETVEELKIIEDTYLTLNDQTKYASVRRTYIIKPSRIDLYTDFDFIKDVFVGTSYVCMLPTSKTYGRNIKFNDTGNIYRTPPSGTTLTTDEFENYIGKEKTLSVEIWGDSLPSYRCLVGIGNEEMVDNFQNQLKVFYWDLNKYGNKLYFSKYNNEDYTFVTKGTKWSNHAYWEYRIVE